MTEEAIMVERFLNQLAEEIKNNIPNATGKSAQSISVSVEEINDPVFGRISGKIEGSSWIWNLEFGRGLTKNGNSGGQTLRESILEWIKAKRIIPEIKAKNPRKNSYSVDKLQEGLSWAIATKIHNEGTALYRSGNQSGIISDVLTDDRLSDFINQLADKAAITVINNVVKQW